MTVYLDIVFIENTLMNYIILITTGIICKEKIKQIRIIIAGILGSIYAVAFYITRFSITVFQYSCCFAKEFLVSGRISLLGIAGTLGFLVCKNKVRFQ